MLNNNRITESLSATASGGDYQVNQSAAVQYRLTTSNGDITVSAS